MSNLGNRKKPNKPIPQEWANKLEAARKSRQMQGERRVITMLFCDVTGSSSMAENLDPEEWAEIMNEAFDYLIAPIYYYEGTVARMMGDGLLAFFGAPVAHEDDPQRAIMAGLDIISELEPYRLEINDYYGLDFNVRVGINTGPVVVGEIGSDLVVEYTAMGDAINLASRMEESAAPGSVQISHYTYNLVRPLFDFEPLGPISVKGRTEPVHTYRVVRRKSSPGRLRGIEGLHNPLVGRNKEFERLSLILSKLNNRGHIVCLTGEAGLGKSRIIQELKLQWQRGYPDPEAWWESNGVAYEMDRPYSLFLQQLRRSFGIVNEDSALTIRSKINHVISQLPSDQGTIIQRAIETLLAVEEGDQPQINAEALKLQLFEAITAAWTQSSANRPVVRVFDDLHWADSASVELIIHLLALVKDKPILFILATRPEKDAQGWRVINQASEYYESQTTIFKLAPLSEEDGGAMVSNLLTIADLPSEMLPLILRKADGNPFFVEEIVRELIDREVVVRDESGLHWRATKDIEDIDIPDNLQALLISRIDRIDKEPKRTLQLASVIGRSFLYRVLAGVSDVQEVLPEQLMTLEESVLITRSSPEPELEYMFHHELTRDAAYHTILHSQRRRYHRRVGETLERIMSDRLGEEAHRLSYHFKQSGDRIRALKYTVMAADTAARLYANQEAVGYYRQALDIGMDVASQDQIEHIYLSLGRTFEVSGRYEDAVAIYQEMFELGTDQANTSLELQALLAQATVQATYTSQYNPEEARKILKESLELAESEKDYDAEAKALWIFMLLKGMSDGDAQGAINYGERSVAIARQNNINEQLAYTLHDLGRPYGIAGRFNDALEVLQEAGALFRSQGNLPMLADNRATLAYGLFLMGRLDEAEVLCAEAITASRESGSFWGEAYASNQLGLLQFERGGFGEAIDSWQRSIELSQRANFVAGRAYAKLGIGRALAFLGSYRRGIALVDEALSHVKKELGQGSEPEFLTVKGILLAQNGELAEAKRLMDHVSVLAKDSPDSNRSVLFTNGQFQLEVLVASEDYELAIATSLELILKLEQRGIRLALPSILLLRAYALFAKGRYSEARTSLAEAYQFAQELGIRRQVWLILIRQAEVEEVLGNSNRLEELKQLAKEEIRFIISQIVDPEVRQTFIALPEVDKYI